MTIDVFVITYNEEWILPYFLKHYDFARHITVLDNESTDRTVEVARRDPRVTIKTWSTGGLQDNWIMREQKNTCWKGCDADYVVVCDADEFVDCRPLKAFGVQEVAFKCMGRQMVGVDGQSLWDIRRYVPYYLMDKTAVFSPRIAEINYGCGAHDARPTCPVVEKLLVLRHYLMLGETYMLRRYRKYSCRISESDKRNGWGTQYLDTDERILGVYRGTLSNALEEPWSYRHSR